MVVYIYKMNVKDKFYIGSTEDIEQRITLHKRACYNIKNNDYNNDVYKYIREYCNDWSEVSFHILDVYDDISDDFKFEMEQYYMDHFDNNLNMRRAIKDPNYYQNNRERILERRKNYYYNNQESVLERSKIYRENNQEKIKARKKIRVICECGLDVNKDHIARHRRTKKHQQLMLNK